jgi:Fur family ferric uptake transcriptional regulator
LKSAKYIFKQYLKEKGTLVSRQREQILNAFIRLENYPTIDDLYGSIREKGSKIGLATVYRTMKVICDSGLARELNFGDGLRHFESTSRFQHNLYLICTECGKITGVTSPEIDRFQKRLSNKSNFTSIENTMKIFGICSDCRHKQKNKRF